MREALEDSFWLVSEEGRSWLAKVAGDTRPTLRVLESLRKDLSATRAHLIVEQVELRRKAQEKFPWADQMFFTRKGLEQATDAWIGHYKARRFSPGTLVADLCCGIGGDLLSLGTRGPVVGVEKDPVCELFARHNLTVVRGTNTDVGFSQVIGGDVWEYRDRLSEGWGWHIDPDRRSVGRRTTRLSLSSPPPEVIEQLLAIHPTAAVKISPGEEVPSEWQGQAELEWISFRGRCRQQVVWFGALAESPGKRRATLLFDCPDPQEVQAESIYGSPGLPTPIAGEIGQVVCDPDPAVLASGLLGQLCQRFGLQALAPQGGYLTGSAPPPTRLVSSYWVEEVLPLDVEKLKRYFRARGIGELVMKKRSGEVDPEHLRARLSLRGTERVHLIVCKHKNRFRAVVVRPI